MQCVHVYVCVGLAFMHVSKSEKRTRKNTKYRQADDKKRFDDSESEQSQNRPLRSDAEGERHRQTETDRQTDRERDRERNKIGGNTKPSTEQHTVQTREGSNKNHFGRQKTRQRRKK